MSWMATYSPQNLLIHPPTHPPTHPQNRALTHMCRNMFLEYRGLPVSVLVAGYDEELTSAGRSMEEGQKRGGGDRQQEEEEEGEKEGGRNGGERGERGGPRLYWMDSLGAIQQLPYAAHGEAASFLVGFLDQQYNQLGDREEKDKEEEEEEEGKRERRKRRLPSLEEALGMLERCYAELETRFLVNSGGVFQVKVVDKDGVRTLTLPRRRRREEKGGRLPPPPLVGGGVKRGSGGGGGGL